MPHPRLRLAAVLLMVSAAVALLPAAADAAEEAGAGAPQGYQRVVDITFPLEGDIRVVDTYDAARGGNTRECLAEGVEGRRHQANDLMAPKMTRIFAAQGGVVRYAPETEPSYGWMISIRGDDGLEYNYLHINNDTPGTDDGQGGIENAYAPGIAAGVRVERGQHIAWVGDSGNAENSGSHLHFEIEDPELDDPALVCPLVPNRLNPYPSLIAALERGDAPDLTYKPAGDSAIKAAPRPASGWIFDDVWPGDTHATAIERLVEAGVTNGCGDGESFCPGTSVSRAQMASFVARALGLRLVGLLPVDDVEVGATHQTAISALLDAGIATLCEERLFCPEDALTRADMAVWLQNALDLDDHGHGFSDVPAGAEYAGAVGAIAEVGVTLGCTATEFCPDEPVSRAQMASFLVRAFLSG